MCSGAQVHPLGWRDVFDIAVRWRQLSEPNDPVWWIDRLVPEVRLRMKNSRRVYQVYGGSVKASRPAKKLNNSGCVPRVRAGLSDVCIYVVLFAVFPVCPVVRGRLRPADAPRQRPAQGHPLPSLL